MRKIALLITTCQLLFGIASSQTPRAFKNVGGGIETPQEGTKGLQGKGISANNFWLGAQVGYKFGGTQEFSDNLLVSGRLLYDIDMKESRLRLPVMGNISTLRDAFSNEKNQNKDTIEARAQELLLSTQGINVGLYPYFVFNTGSDVFSLTLHGSAVWKLNSFKKHDVDENVYIDQGRFSAGLEASLGSMDNGKAPLVVSITPTVTVFNNEKYKSVFNENKSSITSLEITGIVPLGNSIGLLIESIIAKKVNSPFRVGLIFSASE